MEEFLLNHQLCKDYAKVVEASVTPYQNARSIQELGEDFAMRTMAMALIQNIGCPQADTESAASNAAAPRAEADQKPSTVLWEEMAAM